MSEQIVELKSYKLEITAKGVKKFEYVIDPYIDERDNQMSGVHRPVDILHYFSMLQKGNLLVPTSNIIAIKILEVRTFKQVVTTLVTKCIFGKDKVEKKFGKIEITDWVPYKD